MSAKPHLCWITHLGGHTGLARVADNLLSRLADRWRITVLAISTPTPDYTVPWGRVIPARRFHDWLGRIAFRELLAEDPPDIACLFADAWVAAEFLPSVPDDVPMCGYVPCDGYNLRHAPVLNRYAMTIFLSPFAEKEARAQGFTGDATVIGHGVDLGLYHPHDPKEARKALGLPTEGILLGAVGQNQLRKHYDVILYAFRELWLRATQDIRLYCHCRPVDIGWDLPQLVSYLGIADRVLFPRASMDHGYYESDMPWIYSALDIQCSATWGEGFGLTTLEGMACGVPQIVPCHTALADWTSGAAYYLNDLSPETTIGGVNIIGYVPKAHELVDAWTWLIEDVAVRSEFRERGLVLARQPQFRWEVCADQMHAALCAGMEASVGPSARV